VRLSDRARSFRYLAEYQFKRNQLQRVCLMTRLDTQYWDSVQSLLGKGENPIWRAHSDAINSAFVLRSLIRRKVRCALKTDLFDEVAGPGLYPLLEDIAERVVGIDMSAQAARRAQDSRRMLASAAADVRRLPFKSESFDLVVSNSTLDHFEHFREVEDSLRELHRVLKPGAQLIVTLDNLANLTVALRNVLPVAFRRRSRIVPYFVGATCGPARLRKVLAATGFEVHAVEAILHVPRFFALHTAYLVGRYASDELQHRILRGMNGFEVMSRWPTRFLTAYYIGASVVRPP
jgi:SAM-dependent methyltransferase